MGHKKSKEIRNFDLIKTKIQHIKICGPRPAFALAPPPAREQAHLLAAVWLLLAAAACAQRQQDFKTVSVRGKTVPLEKHRGSVSLVVNTASE